MSRVPSQCTRSFRTNMVNFRKGACFEIFRVEKLIFIVRKTQYVSIDRQNYTCADHILLFYWIRGRKLAMAAHPGDRCTSTPIIPTTVYVTMFWASTISTVNTFIHMQRKHLNRTERHFCSPTYNHIELLTCNWWFPLNFAGKVWSTLQYIRRSEGLIIAETRWKRNLLRQRQGMLNLLHQWSAMSWKYVIREIASTNRSMYVTKQEMY